MYKFQAPPNLDPPWKGYSFYAHSAEERYGAQRRFFICPRAHSLEEAGWELDSRVAALGHHIMQASCGKEKFPSHPASKSSAPPMTGLVAPGHSVESPGHYRVDVSSRSKEQAGENGGLGGKTRCPGQEVCVDSCHVPRKMRSKLQKKVE